MDPKENALTLKAKLKKIHEAINKNRRENLGLIILY